MPAGVLQQGAGEPAVVCVRVPNRFKLDWIRTQYAGLIESVLVNWRPSRCGWSLSLATRDTPARQPSVALERWHANGSGHAVAALNLPVAPANGSAHPVESRERPGALGAGARHATSSTPR